MKACKDSRCQYPSEDTMVCSFHEAYATACSMGNVSLPEWRSTAQCDSTQGLCMDTFCANHEFCGIQGDKELCLCRALFASKYQANDTFGEPTVCDRNSASLSLAVCLLAEKGIHYKDLRLNDPNCTGQLNPESHMMDFKFDSVDMCGTEVTSENNQLVFKNKVVLQNHTTSIVTRHDQFELDFSCFYSQPEVKTVVLRIKDSSVVQTITSGTWQYNLTMKSYLDKGRTQPIASETELKLNQPIWVELSTEGLDQNLVSIVVQSSWATSHQLSTSKPRYDLVKNGCPNPRDTSVSVSGNGQGSSASFSFSMFKFSGDSAQVYLHCEVSLCVSKCVPECGSRRRRSLYKDPNPDPNPGLISMSWTN
ncbi:pancreatic secretory granule membrane major glycoprotein GP2-like [Eucyclogobius newberryi]|uniref:pancreatic secretory granule membrane major glycoprotein GP2-like n=1 Tax=Eucyclogobius newberryi TaxID=166745 RepID=UPI003B5C30BA